MIHIPQIEVTEKPQSPFLTKKLVMETLDISKSTLHRWMTEEGLKFYKVSRRVFFKREEFYEWLEQYKKEK
jgi:excisionase family DNA binding protein